MGFWDFGISDIINGATNYLATTEASKINKDAELEVTRYNIEANEKMFEKQKAENAAVWEKNKAYADSVWERQKAYDNMLFDKQAAYNQQMWDKQNAYNTPAAQMERMKAAGLNPALMYTQGNVGNASAQVMPTMGRAVLDKANDIGPATAKAAEMHSWKPGDTLMQGIGNYITVMNKDLERRQLAAQNALIAENINRVKAETEQTREQTRGFRRENNLLEDNKISMRDPFWLRFAGRFGEWWEKQHNDFYMDPKNWKPATSGSK